MAGEGTFTWPTGEKYEGNFKDHKKSGYGIFTWQDGCQFKGNWERGLQNGLGVYFNAKGEFRQGEWKNGKRLKWMEASSDLNLPQDDARVAVQLNDA